MDRCLWGRMLRRQNSGTQNRELQAQICLNTLNPHLARCRCTLCLICIPGPQVQRTLQRCLGFFLDQNLSVQGGEYPSSPLSLNIFSLTILEVSAVHPLLLTQPPSPVRLPPTTCTNLSKAACLPTLYFCLPLQCGSGLRVCVAGVRCCGAVVGQCCHA